MMPVIRIDDDVLGWLKGEARPFEETTPNAVLRRIAGFDGSGSTSDSVSEPMRRVDPRPNGTKTPQGEFRGPILQVLLKNGGCANRMNALKEIESILSKQLTTFDRQDLKSGTIRWQKSAEWEVSTMRQAGLLLQKTQSPRGVWCLSTEGERIARAASLLSDPLATHARR